MIQIINLLLLIAFMLGAFAIGGWYIEYQEKQEQKQLQALKKQQRKAKAINDYAEFIAIYSTTEKFEKN